MVAIRESNQSVCCESSGLARRALYKRTYDERSGAAYRIERAESEARCETKSQAEWVNEFDGPVATGRGNNTRFLTPRAISCPRTSQASFSLSVEGHRYAPLQGCGPPFHVFTPASGPHRQATGTFFGFAPSLCTRFAGSPVALFTVPVTRNGIRASIKAFTVTACREIAELGNSAMHHDCDKAQTY